MSENPSFLAIEEFPPLPSQIHQQTPHDDLFHNQRVHCSKNDGAPVMRLPDELLLEILGYLHPGWFSIYLRLSLVNRRFYFLTRNELYVRYDSLSKRAYPFMRTLMINPQVARLVRYIHFSYRGPNDTLETERKLKYPPRGRRHYIPTVADKHIIKNSLKALNIPKWKDWATDCNNATSARGQELLYTTILMYSPNVEKLIIDYDDFSSTYRPRWIDLIRSTVRGGGFGNVHRFVHLRFVQVYAGPLRPYQLAPLFKLPALRHLKLASITEAGEDRKIILRDLRRLMPPKGTCRIERLNLLACCLGSDVIDVMLQCINSLKTFKHILEVDFDADDDVAVLHYPELKVSLSRFEDTLEHLSLGLTGRPIISAEHVSLGVLGDLSNFTGVVQFGAPIDALIARDQLTKYNAARIKSSLVQCIPPATKILSIDLSRYASPIRKIVQRQFMDLQEQGVIPSLETLKFIDSKSAMRSHYGEQSDEAEMESDGNDEREKANSSSSDEDSDSNEENDDNDSSEATEDETTEDDDTEDDDDDGVWF